MLYVIQMHNGNGWGDMVRPGYATRERADEVLARLRECFLPSLQWRVIERGAQ